MQAQCGGGQNIAHLRERMGILAASPEYAPFLANFPSPWLFQNAEDAADTLRRSGFVEVETGLEPALIVMDNRQHYMEFLKTVIVRTHLDRLPDPGVASSNTYRNSRIKPRPMILPLSSITGG